MERETGIEPATNSLEGCDSTTELLPPTRLASFVFPPLRRGKPAYASRPLHLLAASARHSRRLHALPASMSAANHPLVDAPFGVHASLIRSASASLATRASVPTADQPCAGFQPKLARTRERAKAGGEGRIRTSEGLSRQIYSLLRLTASLPRRSPHIVSAGAVIRACGRMQALLSYVRICAVRDVRGGTGPKTPVCSMFMELAKGFEPPTG